MLDTAVKKMKEFIPKTITTDQAKDTGMAMVLICLLIAFFGGKQFFYGLAILLLLINMIWPNVFKPVAKIWLGFSHHIRFCHVQNYFKYNLSGLGAACWFCQKSDRQRFPAVKEVEKRSCFRFQNTGT